MYVVPVMWGAPVTSMYVPVPLRRRKTRYPARSISAFGDQVTVALRVAVSYAVLAPAGASGGTVSTSGEVRGA